MIIRIEPSGGSFLGAGKYYLHDKAHQAVLVGHNDTGHRHIHIILNRVNPENGRTIDDYREQKRAQVWALAYEKQHENLRCEERELRAAKREGRAPELDIGNEAGKHNEPQPDTRQTQRTPANDHLPHNVIMLSREHEKTFNAQEQARETADREQRAVLKAEQRAEREAFFKDGAREFKALRHAVYDEVRKDYAPEWRDFYKDAKVAEQSAEAWSKSSVTRALYFAREGRWEEAGNAFADRDSVRDAVSAELNERKSDLKARQTEDLRERQRAACDALREQRDVQYQELLQRQREERGAFNAGVTLDALGIVQERAGGDQSVPVPGHTANENRNAGQAAVQEPKADHGLDASQQDAKSGEQQHGDQAAARSSASLTASQIYGF